MSDTEIYGRQNFGKVVGFGRSPALVIVDFTVGFNDPEVFGGGNIGSAVNRTVGLLTYFRQAKRPVAFTRIVYSEDGSDAGAFVAKVPGLRILTESHPAAQIVPELAPLSGELIVRKTQPSAFFATSLLSWLIHHAIDTIIVAGCTTSGCVRATVVDACSHNFKTIVARDCVGDRAIGPHEANLFDMEQKYADVLNSDEIVGKLGNVRSRSSAIS
jgi:maleamate amidohydrolase